MKQVNIELYEKDPGPARIVALGLRSNHKIDALRRIVGMGARRRLRQVLAIDEARGRGAEAAAVLSL